MKKLLLSSMLSAALIGGLACASRAITFDVSQPSLTAPLGSDTFMAGVTTNGGVGSFTATLIQGTPFQTFATDSSVSFGITTQTGAANAPDFATYTNVPATFSFDLTIPSASLCTKSFVVSGLINGMTTFDGTNGGSNAAFAPASIKIDGSSAAFLSGVVSPAGRVSLEIPNLNFCGVAADVFFDQTDALTAPGPNSPLTVGGYVRSAVTSVPEPGTLPMLLGSGVAGSLLLLRRRRA